MTARQPYYADDSVTLWHGDSLEVLRELPAASVDCCVTSPPYFGLRDYGVEGQYGLEASPAEYVETMRALFAEVRRVLTDDGTLWLNLGDSYAGSGKGRLGDGSSDATGKQATNVGSVMGKLAKDKSGLAAKNLIGIPWRVAFALQDDGWILRSEVIWAKSNAMPEPVTDRVSCKHEHFFMFAKSPRYWFDLDPIREQYAGDRDLSRRSRSGAINKENSVPRAWPPVGGTKQEGITSTRSANVPAGEDGGRNPGDVWTIPTQPFSAAHFAVMPQTLASRAISAGCKPDGVVLDPFSGSGTTGLAAAKNGRRYVGVDLSSDYLDLSLKTRLAQSALDFGEATA